MTTGHAGNPDSRPILAGSVAARQRGSARCAFADPLYSTVRIAAWAAYLLETPPFRRLAGVSLSDVPGDWLFGHPFPTRLDHARGVYHLARLARPRDRALQAAALAHDLGHGPFSHLTEPLMRERLGEDHERRSARLLDDVRRALPAAAHRRLAWLDWDEVARLILARDADGRGELLNGLLDYDNADNVARFLLASSLGVPSYDPRALARALRVAPLSLAAPEESHTPANGATPVDGAYGRSGDGRGDGGPPRRGRVYLQAGAEAGALAWLNDRGIVYGYLHEGHKNLALHAMLRKAVDLAAARDALPDTFFDLTDERALRALRGVEAGGVRRLVDAARGGEHYECVWEAELPERAAEAPGILAGWRERLGLEARLAAEAALAPDQVVIEALVSSAHRELPPIATSARPEMPGPFRPLGAAAPARRLLHLFAAPSAGSDYVRRLCMAAERHLGVLGATARLTG